MPRKRHMKKPAETQEKESLCDAVDRIAPKESTDFSHNASGERVQSRRLVKIRRFPVAWGIPLDEVVFSRWFVNFTGLKIMPWDTIITAQSTYLPDARNIIHRDFLSTGLDWLVMLDSDVLPPLNFLDRLLSHKLPMVGGWYRKKGDPYPPCVYDDEGYDEATSTYKYRVREAPGEGLEVVDAAGAGCWLMSKEVAQAIGEKPYDMLHGGEDLALCRRVREAGYKLHIDWTVACAHTGVAIV